MNKELAVNTTLSHYPIVSKLGAGGMSEVIWMGLRWWRDLLIRSQTKRYLDDR